MSFRATAWAWTIPLPAPQKIVLIRLADTARDDGTEAWRSMARMVAETGLSERTVRNALRGLEDAELALVDRPADPGKKHTTVYRLSIPGDYNAANKTPAGDAPLRGQEMPPYEETGAGGAAVGGHVMPDRGAGGAPSLNNSLNNISEQETPARKRAPDDTDTVIAMVDIWRDELGGILPVPNKIDSKRRKAALARLKDSLGGDLDAWREACRKVKASRFLTGDNDRGWKADFDFLMRRDKLLKLSEGSYDDRPAHSSHRSSEDRMAQVGDVFNEIRLQKGGQHGR